jgi:hypothetical protein
MELHHRSGQVSRRHFADARALFAECLGFEEFVATEHMSIFHQTGSGIDIQLICSDDFQPQQNKHLSHLGFISSNPRQDRESIRQWSEDRGLTTELGQWSDRELWIDLPEVFLDFVIEVMHRRILEEPVP